MRKNDRPRQPATQTLYGAEFHRISPDPLDAPTFGPATLVDIGGKRGAGCMNENTEAGLGVGCRRFIYIEQKHPIVFDFSQIMQRGSSSHRSRRGGCGLDGFPVRVSFGG